MLVYRAEDGEVFQVNKTLHDIEKQGGLERVLQQVTGIEGDAILAYLSDGHRLRDDNLRELAGSSDQSIFVFNKNYLDYEVEDILVKIRADPALQPDIHNISSETLEALANTGIRHYDSIVHVLNTIHVQHEALRIASTTLDLNVLSISDVFEGFAGGARRELEKQASLLEGLELDLEVIGKIKIHPEFLSPAFRRAVEAGEKARTLGDYVSNLKMRQVGDACSKAHIELRKRFDAAEVTINQLKSGANEVRSSTNSSLLDEAETCAKRAQEALNRISDIKEQLLEPCTDERELFEELHKQDTLLRDEVRLIADLKNKSTALVIHVLRHISHLNNHLIALPPTLSTLQSDFRSKANYNHIERLHKMLYAYGATLVEIVRRKEFSRFFSQKVQMIAEVMAKFSSNERKQRQIFRGEVHGQLPFDTKGMDDTVPAMEITSTGTSNIAYSIEREDLMMLLEEIDKMERSQNSDGLNGHFNVNSLGETRSRLERLIMRIDNLEPSFDKMVEKTIFSASRILLPRRQATDHTDSEFQELIEQLHEIQDAKGELERQFEEERQALQGEFEQLHAELTEVQEFAAHHKHHSVHLENDLAHALEAKEQESIQRSEKEAQLAQQRVEIVKIREELSTALQLKDDQNAVVERLQGELAATKIDLVQTKQLEREASQRFLTTLSEKEHLSTVLYDTQAREEALKNQVLDSQRDAANVKQALIDAQEESERRLRVQAVDADRALRDVIAEADGDRAVLEHQVVKLTALLESTERQLTSVKAELDVVHADIAGLREEFQRAEHEATTFRKTEAILKREVESVHSTASDYSAQLEESRRIAKELLRIAIAFRDSYCRAFATTQSPPSSSKSIANLAESTALIKSYAEPPPIDPEDIIGGLEVLSVYDPINLPDAIGKMASTIRKWQKQCKEYRDRARSKISFRNFAKGDLALFLPTRNSVSKPWAAFNVSFPHYFLQASGNLAEQLKTREWIVARISSITEQLVDPKDPSTNPYGLSDGTKFYMLQVEDWTQSSSRRKSSPPNRALVTAAMDSPAITPAPISEVGSSAAATAPFPQMETLGPAAKHILNARQRTHSAPVNPSSLPHLLERGTPPIEEVAENSSPSPPTRPSHSPSPIPESSLLAGPHSLFRRANSPPIRVPSPPTYSPSPVGRPSSPVRQSISPLQRSESPLGRPSSPPARPSPLTRPPQLRSPPTVCSLPRSRPPSPLATTVAVHVSARTGSPLADVLASDSESRIRSVGRSIPTHPSPISPKPASPLQHPASRRSSSSSRPSTSSIFSASRHPFTKSASQAPKAAATTALSDPKLTNLPETPDRERFTSGDKGTPSPEGSLTEGLSNVVIGRRRTTSTVSNVTRDRSSQLSLQASASTSRPQSSQGPLASLANSWGFGRRARTSISERTPSSANASATAITRGTHTPSTSPSSGRILRSAGASDILRRYDDILPQERGAR